MSPRSTSVYRCQDCGFASPKPGTCPDCARTGSWVALVEERAEPRASGRRSASTAATRPIALKDVALERGDRLPTGLGELDRVLGGGVVRGSLVLIGGDPGIGKSTLLLQAARALTRARPPVLYVSAEESAAQVKMRADRLGIAVDGLLLWAETDLAAVQAQLDDVKPQALIVDSIQTVFLPDLDSAPGSVAQVRECGSRLMTLAKGRGIATFLVGHVTKEGALAGPRVLEHLVDTVLYFEGEQHHAYRVLRAVKNRFGSTNEIGVFEMTASGLVGVPEPSELFGRSEPGEVGAAVTCTLEGTRPLLLEVQALVSPTDLAMPRRVGTGVDPKRLAMIVAVLARHAGLPLGGADVFVNVAGGVRIDEPGGDLGIALAIASAAKGAPVRDGVASFGEIGLTGRLRAATQADRRVEECRKLGLTDVLAPSGTSGAALAADTLGRALAAGLAPQPKNAV